MENDDDIKTSLFYAQIDKSNSAKSLFNKIDADLDASLFVLAFKKNDSDENHRIYVGENDFGIKPDLFEDVSALVKNIKTRYKLGATNQDHLNSMLFREEIDRYKNEILRKLEQYDPLIGNKYFIGVSATEKLKTFYILSFNKYAFEKYYRLTKVKDERWHTSLSFLEALVSSFFHMPQIHSNSTIEINEAYLKHAGRYLIETVARSSNMMGSLSFYDNCNEIASMKYEGDIALGGMILCKPQHKNLKMTMTLREPISINNHRKARKILEISDKDTLIITDSEKIYGFGEIKGKYNPMEEDLFVVRFLGHYRWDLLHNGETMMSVEFKLPKLPQEKLDEKKFKSDIVRIFNNIKPQDVAKFWEIIATASEQKHGTMLVISSEAESESKRLSGQCFTIEPTTFDSKLLRGATSIDGAVLFDDKAYCHAIGVILDGVASNSGDSSRGARYNSAFRYYDTKKDSSNLLIVVVSEDGMINIIPDLKPMIRHAEITNHIVALKELTETYDQKKYFECMEFLYEKAFYLTQEECDSVNSLKEVIQSKSKNEDNMSINFSGDFYPNKDMNESFYLKD